MSAAPVGRKGLTVEEARALVLEGAGLLGTEAVSLAEAEGRTLAEDIFAWRDQPPFAASAMDGWAVRGGGPRFRIVGESAAGRGYGAVLRDGEAVRIFTGAPVPEGADRVVIQENAQREGDDVSAEAPAPGANIRAAGGDFLAGALLLARGLRLDPWRIALAAAAGRPSVLVARRPQVIVLSTGEELVPAGAEPGPYQIFNSGGPSLGALIRRWGAEARVLAAGDDMDAIAAAVSGAGGDLVVTLGGASVGDHDLVKPALARLGLELSFETVKLRPGKPTWFGRLGDGRPVVGLPGNPSSAFVCAELFLRPLLNTLLGAPAGPVLESAHLAAPVRANGPREHWTRARLAVVDGALMATPMGDQDSSLVSVFALADALVRQSAGAPAAEAGDLVDILRLDRL